MQVKHLPFQPSKVEETVRNVPQLITEITDDDDDHEHDEESNDDAESEIKNSSPIPVNSNFKTTAQPVVLTDRVNTVQDTIMTAAQPVVVTDRANTVQPTDTKDGHVDQEVAVSNLRTVHLEPEYKATAPTLPCPSSAGSAQIKLSWEEWEAKWREKLLADQAHYMYPRPEPYNAETAASHTSPHYPGQYYPPFFFHPMYGLPPGFAPLPSQPGQPQPPLDLTQPQQAQEHRSESKQPEPGVSGVSGMSGMSGLGRLLHPAVQQLSQLPSVQQSSKSLQQPMESNSLRQLREKHHPTPTDAVQQEKLQSLDEVLDSLLSFQIDNLISGEEVLLDSSFDSSLRTPAISDIDSPLPTRSRLGSKNRKKLGRRAVRRSGIANVDNVDALDSSEVEEDNENNEKSDGSGSLSSQSSVSSVGTGLGMGLTDTDVETLLWLKKHHPDLLG